MLKKIKIIFQLSVLFFVLAGFGFFANEAQAAGEACGYYAEGICKAYDILSPENITPTPTACPDSSAGTCYAPFSFTATTNVLNLSATTPQPGAVILSWSRPSTIDGLWKYRVYRGSQWLADIDPSYNAAGQMVFNDLVRPGPYVYRVTSIDNLSHENPAMMTPTVTVQALDMRNAEVRNLNADENPDNSGIVDVTWQIPSNLTVVSSYIISRVDALGNEVILAQTVNNRVTSFRDQTVPAPGRYTYALRTVDIYRDATSVTSAVWLDVFGTNTPTYSSYDAFCTSGMVVGAACNDGTNDGRCVVGASNELYCLTSSLCTPTQACTDASSRSGTCVGDSTISYCMIPSSSGGGSGSGSGSGGTGGSTPGGYPGGQIGPFNIPGGTGMSDATIPGIIIGALYWLLGTLATVTVIMFVISGMRYLLSAGNSSIAEGAKNQMVWSIVGVVVAMSGLIIVKSVEMILLAS